MAFWTRLRNTLFPGKLRRELNAEMEAHLDEMRLRARIRMAGSNLAGTRACFAASPKQLLLV